MIKYAVEFILHSRAPSEGILRNSLSECGENLRICAAERPDSAIKDFKISIICEEPTIIFDICSQFGRIKTVRINEV
ncbi:MAG: hypothetical protein QME65_04755 [Candidatus Omnitrophota bacterium]|nr:hypothetical protein [Candidatus Omnitrophota bacterium]